MLRNRHYSGISLVETMIIIIVICILTTIAIPNFIQFMQRYRLVSTIQNIYYNLQYARSEALKRAVIVYVTFNAGSNWCYGISTASTCSCSTPSSCNLGSYTPPNGQLTTLSLSGFSSLHFDGSRGTSSAAGTITLTASSGTNSMGIDIGTVGNLQICSNNINGYPLC